jgi:hypothetical protein
VQSLRESLGAYDDNEEEVTRFVEPAPEEPRWLVQVTPFDRRSMSRERLLAELLRGGLVCGDTLVWRRGMRNWSALARVGELGAPETLPPARAPVSPARAAERTARPPSPSEAGIVLASSAAALLVVAVTLALLAWGGVFQGGAPAQPSQSPSSASR